MNELIAAPAAGITEHTSEQTIDQTIEQFRTDDDFDAFVRREGSLPPAAPARLGIAPTAQLLDVADADDGELTWQERALCAQTDPEAFFPEKGGSTREAKRVCVSCEVRAECLEYALAHDERFGIWGGLSERERRRLKKQAG